MKSYHMFTCPETGEKLNFDAATNTLKGPKRSYPIRNGVANLIYPEVLSEGDLWSKNWYDQNTTVYDKYLHLTFETTFGVDETAERKKMVKTLNLKPGMKVLETGAGTGRDSVLIAEALGGKGELHVQDISESILQEAMPKLKDFPIDIFYSAANAQYLPFPDKYFDAYYHFGGFNTFNDKKRAFAEISRVVKPGGRVVVGDESMPPWYRETEFGKVLMNSNPHYNFDLPLKDLHYTVRDLSIHYIVAGVFYYFEYTVGDGEPKANLDFEIPGERGGTHRTRYYGQLEGLSAEAVAAAKEARKKSGMSMHQWLSSAVLDAAKKQK